FPGMRQYAHRTRQNEKPARKRRWKAEFAINDSSGAINVERDVLSLPASDAGLDRLGNIRETACNNAACGEISCHFQKSRRARVNWVESVAEAWHIAFRLGEKPVQLRGNRIFDSCTAVHRHGDIAEKGERLFAGAAMHITQHVDGRGHGAVYPDSAGCGHACDCDRWRLGSVVDGRSQGYAQQFGLFVSRQLAAQHQPDHRRERYAADQVLDLVATQTDDARHHFYDGRLPPFFCAIPAGFFRLIHRLVPARFGSSSNTSSMCSPSAGGGAAGRGGWPLTRKPPRTTVRGRFMPGTFSNSVVRARLRTCSSASTWGMDRTRPAGT